MNYQASSFLNTLIQKSLKLLHIMTGWAGGEGKWGGEGMGAAKGIVGRDL